VRTRIPLPTRGLETRAPRTCDTLAIGTCETGVIDASLLP
jgi:hypothetical protein